MNQAQLIEGLMAGRFLAVGEYRLSKAEMLNWVDKKNGQPKSAPILRHTVEFGSASVAVNERVPDNTRLEDIHVPFKKGELVALTIEELTSAKGLISCRGRLEKFQDGNVPLKGGSVASGGRPSST